MCTAQRSTTRKQYQNEPRKHSSTLKNVNLAKEVEHQRGVLAVYLKYKTAVWRVQVGTEA